MTKHTADVADDAKAQMERLPKSVQEQVARTLAMLLDNPYLVGTELVGATRTTEIRRTQAGPSVLMDYEFPTNARVNARTPPVLKVLELSIAEL